MSHRLKEMVGVPGKGSSRREALAGFVHLGHVLMYALRSHSVLPHLAALHGACESTYLAVSSQGLSGT